MVWEGFPSPSCHIINWSESMLKSLWVPLGCWLFVCECECASGWIAAWAVTLAMVGSVSGRFSVTVCFGPACQREREREPQSESGEERAQERWRKKEDRPPARPGPGVLCAGRQDSKCVGVCFWQCTENSIFCPFRHEPTAATRSLHCLPPLVELYTAVKLLDCRKHTSVPHPARTCSPPLTTTASLVRTLKARYAFFQHVVFSVSC